MWFDFPFQMPYFLHWLFSSNLLTTHSTPEGALLQQKEPHHLHQNTLRRDPPNLGNFISRVRRKNDPQYFYTLRRKSWCICTQALNKYYNKHSRLIKNATEPWLLLHSNEKCRTSCYCRHCIQFPLIRFSFG